MYKTYILCHHSKEQPQRYISLQKQVEHFRLKNVSFFSNTWKDDITPKIRKTYCKSLTCTFKKDGRTQPLHDAEISIFLNYISLLRKIKEENSDGLFITIESDAVLSNDYTTRIESVIESVSQLQKWDVINIGEGTRRGLRNPKYGYPKSKPIVINGHSFHHEDIHAAIEGLIWNYDGVCKFLSEFDLTQEIDGPIDTKMDWLSINGKFNIYWLEPTLMVNGTIFNIYKSDIPKPWNAEYKTTIHRTLKSKKILHLSFHKGCINDFHYICDKLGHTCEVLSSFKECCTNQSIEPIWEPDNRHYMITHESAIKYWNRYKDYFNEFDTIVTSDTAILSRIFLQNGWTKPLVIWICNRFDYFHTSRPDKEYFELFHRATKQPNVQIIPNTLFEVLYCSLYNISLNSPEIITPLGKNIPSVSLDKTSLPNKRNTFFIPSYHNETTMMNLPLKLQELGIETYNERHKGGHDLIEFKGIITIPYAYSTLALFEHLSLGITIFVPNPSFLLSFLKDPKLNFWHQNSNMLPKYMQISEWYNEKHSKLIIYFDSWEDLKKKVSTLDYENHKSKLIEYGKKHEKDVCEKWNKVLT